MACYHPLTGYRSQTVNPNTGKRSIVFPKHEGFSDLPVELPCGQCIGCRLERSRMWAIRCVHESQLHDQNSFITLTYNDQNLPRDLSLHKKHLQDFFKRLRKKLSPKKVRFYACGEYGENFGRPHYHACLFGHDFDDKILFSNKNGQRLYISQTLTDVWGLGHATTGHVTFESAAYVARYIMKKITGPKAYVHYNLIDKTTGEVLAERTPEFTNMSRKPGIASAWYEKYKSDVFPRDEIILRGKRLKPPRYYRDRYEITDAKKALILKLERQDAAKQSVDNTWDRLKVREEVQNLRLLQLKRSFENGQT